MTFESLKPRLANIISATPFSVTDKLTQVCELLQTSLPFYNWVGFYFADEAEKTLHLKAFAGVPTGHTVIPFGKGICGQVAESNTNFVVGDVQAQDNYIACDIAVKAEIVIPLFKDGKNIGQIDIDSHTDYPFTAKDERFLEWVNEKVAEIL
ncbi:MAG: GAF domain-containing protein [Bacteroidetes bacterium]|nr:MAG: GAF domain-containing protein [Bacteroidota bacterium]